MATGSSTHLLPLEVSHALEQHWAFAVQSVPSRRHSVPPQLPALHAKEQQSLARWQAAPTGLHSPRQVRVVVPFTGSHNPLQQSALDEHGVPAPAQAPGSAHVLDEQCVEQQSEALPQVSPSGRQVGGGDEASQVGTPPSPWSRPPSSEATCPMASGSASAASTRDEPASPWASSMSSAPQASSARLAASAAKRGPQPLTERRAPRKAPPPHRADRDPAPAHRAPRSAASASGRTLQTTASEIAGRRES